MVKTVGWRVHLRTVVSPTRWEDPKNYTKSSLGDTTIEEGSQVCVKGRTLPSYVRPHTRGIT